MAKKKSIRALRKPPRLPRSLRKGPLPETPSTVWTAGLGALASALGDGRSGFDALVAEGRRVEAAGGAAVREALRQAGVAAATIAGTAAEAAAGALEEAAESALGRAGVPERSDVDALRAHLRRLEDRLARMTGAVTEPAAVAVVAAGDEWAVRIDGREASVHPTKRAAVSAGRRAARENGPARLVVHKLDGTAGETTDYGEAG